MSQDNSSSATQDVDLEDEVAHENLSEDREHECAAVPTLLAAVPNLE